MTITKKIFFALVIATISLSTCSKEEECVFNDPLEDLEWLKEIATNLSISMSISGFQIISYKYRGEYVFWIDRRNGLVLIYNCQGDLICKIGGIEGENTCPGFKDEAVDSTMLLDGVQH